MPCYGWTHDLMHVPHGLLAMLHGALCMPVGMPLDAVLTAVYVAAVRARIVHVLPSLSSAMPCYVYGWTHGH